LIRRSLAALALPLFACGSHEAPPPAAPNESAPAATALAVYAFDPIDERQVSSEVNRGKPTVIAFVTTGDIIGQAQVSYLVHMARNDGDRVNYALVALHPRKEIVLVDAYRKTLGVEFPVALGDYAATNHGGPFGEIPAVPTTVILDHHGRLAWKHTGLVKSDELRAHMHGL
jgi:hypothetical protein